VVCVYKKALTITVTFAVNKDGSQMASCQYGCVFEEDNEKRWV